MREVVLYKMRENGLFFKPFPLLTAVDAYLCGMLRAVKEFENQDQID
jgi:hypothetical protein